MRIISGHLKGRRLIAPKSLPTRPTTDMAKEALFNILNNQYYFDEIKVLDLFSGTGNISYEFASRGCNAITSIDNYWKCVEFIEETAAHLNINIKAIKRDVFKYLETQQDNFDVIFADPPYNLDLHAFETMVELVFENHTLSKQGLLVIEHSKHTDLSHIEQFSYLKTYGSSAFSFFEAT